EIEFEIRVECRVDYIRWDGHKQRVAVRRRIYDGLSGDIAASPRAVLNNELLAEPLRQPLTREARDDVGRVTRRVADNDMARPRRIGLCRRDARHGRERGSARCEIQKLSTGKFHCIAL